ncbi:hypothetical protein GLYMA_05G107400v4 [Glycine max]|uniref:Uncharacterized protein n=2 Tax=Glycine subgen. Soja TaxID=1462606 RepID=A0A0R0K402_SOYBN|nr:hypothetical protein JHK85_012924 [Glycine max]KAH1133787.1 hypothetical protein GYH30_012267 [Glycine max]KRH58143.1 hypothetical protein GLYMA_05G107400v4 [Glycine max]RZC11918.1 hypothetical protein D0Y65_011923 [Glycine soja]
MKEICYSWIKIPRRGIAINVELVISVIIVKLFCSMASLYCIFFPLGVLEASNFPLRTRGLTSNMQM